MPVHLVYGDSFLVAGALKELRQEVGPPEVWEANCHYIAAAEASLGSVMPMCDAVPFLGERRLVVVEGALSAIERQPRGARSRPTSRGGAVSAGWDGLEAYVERMPPTTLLVFADGNLRGRNPLLERLRPLAQLKALPTPTGEALSRWVRTVTAAHGASIVPGAIGLLNRLVGPDLWALDNELEKLALYAAGAPISEAHVRELVTQAREASIFNLVDALVEGRATVALRASLRLRESGADFSYIVAMIARQLRQVLLARDLVDNGCPWSDVGQRLEVSAEFALRKTLEQARKHTRQGLVQLYEALLEADLAVKQGRTNEDLALELLLIRSPRPH